MGRFRGPAWVAHVPPTRRCANHSAARAAVGPAPRQRRPHQSSSVVAL